MTNYIFGHIEGQPIHSIYPNRRQCHDAKIHVNLQKGIGAGGASIVLSGGYEDDKDLGDEIIYTGEGGRDPNTGAQVANQTITGGNKQLIENCNIGHPIRVIRGHQLDSKFAPNSGYRYDGLYLIERYWQERGRAKFNIIRFKLVKADGMLPPAPQGGSTPTRTTSTINRIQRNSQRSEEIKRLYNFKCQICGEIIETPTGRYAEACHIRPLGDPHNGQDTKENLLCLCPNCHKRLDRYSIKIQRDLTITSSSHLNGKRIYFDPSHRINPDNIDYLLGMSILV